MKFEYNTGSKEPECVAYVDGYGDLVFPSGDDHALTLERNGKVSVSDPWSPSEAAHKFYPGDKVTITF